MDEQGEREIGCQVPTGRSSDDLPGTQSDEELAEWCSQEWIITSDHSTSHWAHFNTFGFTPEALILGPRPEIHFYPVPDIKGTDMPSAKDPAISQPTGDQLAAKGLDAERSVLPEGFPKGIPLTPQDQIQADPTTPPTLDQIKDAVRYRAKNAQDVLDALRKDREILAARIRVAVLEVVEARRILNSLEPRTRK